MSKNKIWLDKVRKHLVGQTITDVKWLSPKDTEKFFGWDTQPCEIFLSNGVVLTPQADDEGNDAGAIATTIDDLPIIPVFRD